MSYIDSLCDLWDWIVAEGIATEEELQLVTDINGFSEDTLNDIIYARTGYNDKNQYLGIDDEEEDEEEEEE